MPLRGVGGGGGGCGGAVECGEAFCPRFDLVEGVVDEDAGALLELLEPGPVPGSVREPLCGALFLPPPFHGDPVRNVHPIPSSPPPAGDPPASLFSMVAC